MGKKGKVELKKKRQAYFSAKRRFEKKSRKDRLKRRKPLTQDLLNIRHGLDEMIREQGQEPSPIAYYGCLVVLLQAQPDAKRLPYFFALLDLAMRDMPASLLQKNVHQLLTLTAANMKMFMADGLILKKGMQIFKTAFQLLIPTRAMLQALQTLEPNKVNHTVMPMYLKTLSAALLFINDDERSRDILADNLVSFVKTTTANLFDTAESVATAAAKAVKLVLSKSVSLDIVVRKSDIVTRLLQHFGACLTDIQYRNNWDLICECASVLLGRLALNRSTAGAPLCVKFPVIVPLTVSFDKLRALDDFHYNGAAEAALGAALKCMSAEKFLEVVPVDVLALDPIDGRHYLLQVLRRNVSHDSLAFFVKRFAPLITQTRKAADDALLSNKKIERKVLQQIHQQLWELLPGFAKFPQDLSDGNTYKVVAKELTSLFKEPELCKVACKTLVVLIEKSKYLAEYEPVEEEEGEESESYDEESEEEDEARAAEQVAAEKELKEDDDDDDEEDEESLDPVEALEAKLPELLGTDFCEAPPEADPLTFHMISKERAEGYLATMRGFAKNIVPLVCNAIERDESDRRMPLLLTLRSYASISEKPVLNTVFKQVSKALVEARHTTEPLTEVQMKRNHVMMDIGCVIAEYLDADALSILMDVISPLLIDESSDALLQKKSYKALARICKTRGADIGDQLDRIVQLLAESQKRCSAASKRERIQCMVHVAILHRDSNEVEQLKAFVDGTVSEVMLALKEVNTRTRDAAFMCLSMYAELVQVNTFTNTVLAGFAGTTPAIVSATIVTLSKLLHEFHESMDYKLKETVIKACLMLIKHKSNEIKNAAMSFTRLVLKLVSEREDIKAIMEQNLQLVVDGCLAWTSQKQTPGNTRRNVQLILERCIKRFGYEYMLSLFPEEHRKYLEYIEKERRKEIKKAIKEREARRNPGAAAAGAGARRSKFNELFYGVQKKRKVKSEVLAMPGDETEMDLLDGDVVKRLVGHKAHTALDVRVNNAKEDGMRVSSVNGQIVVQTDADYRRDRRQQLLERKVGEMEGTHRGAFEELGLTKRKRRRDEEQPLDDDVNMFEGGARAAAEEFKKLQDALRGKKERPKDGISKRRRVDTDVRAGAHFKAKGSSGDVKKGAVEPFAYVPLNAKFLNKRHRMKSIARVGAVAETAPRGNKAKQGGSNKRSASSRR